MCRRDVERLPVFGDGAAGDVYALLFEEADKGFVGMGLAAVFVFDNLPQNGFNRALAQAFFVAFGIDCLCEEIA